MQLNKANISDKVTSFLDINIKVIGNNIYSSVYDKRDDFGFPIVNFSWLSGDVPRLPSSHRTTESNTLIGYITLVTLYNQ